MLPAQNQSSQPTTIRNRIYSSRKTGNFLFAYEHFNKPNACLLLLLLLLLLLQVLGARCAALPFMHTYIYIVCRHNTVWTTSIHPSIWIVAVKERITSENDTEKKFKGPFYLHLSLKYLSFTVCVGYTYIYVLGSCVTFCTCHARTTENVVCFCRRTEKIFRYVENDFGRQFETRGVEFIRRHLISGTHHAPNLLATRIHIHMIMMAYLF